MSIIFCEKCNKNHHPDFQCHTLTTKQEQIREEFYIWYKAQKEINPYILRDFFLQKRSQEFEELERRIEKTLESTVDYGKRIGLREALSIIKEIYGKNKE